MAQATNLLEAFYSQVIVSQYQVPGRFLVGWLKFIQSTLAQSHQKIIHSRIEVATYPMKTSPVKPRDKESMQMGISSE